LRLSLWSASDHLRLHDASIRLEQSANAAPTNAKFLGDRRVAPLPRSQLIHGPFSRRFCVANTSPTIYIILAIKTTVLGTISGKNGRPVFAASKAVRPSQVFETAFRPEFELWR